MQIGGISAHSLSQAHLHPSPATQPSKSQLLDNDGDHDHGAPDGVRGQHIDIKA